MERLEEFLTTLKKISEKTTLLNPLETIKWNINKKYLLELQENGISTIPTQLYTKISQDNIASLFDQFDKGDGIIIKPTIGASSLGIQYLQKKEQFTSELTGEWLVQSFQPNIKSHGEYSLLFFGGKFSHAICKKPKEGEFRSQEEFESNITSWSPDNHALDLAEKVLSSIDVKHEYARVDMVLDKENKYVLMELELIEPCLFLRFQPEKAQNFANVLLKRLA